MIGKLWHCHGRRMLNQVAARAATTLLPCGALVLALTTLLLGVALHTTSWGLPTTDLVVAVTGVWCYFERGTQNRHVRGTHSDYPGNEKIRDCLTTVVLVTAAIMAFASL